MVRRNWLVAFLAVLVLACANALSGARRRRQTRPAQAGDRRVAADAHEPVLPRARRGDEGRGGEERDGGGPDRRRVRRRQAAEPGERLHRQAGQRDRAVPVRLQGHRHRRSPTPTRPASPSSRPTSPRLADPKTAKVEGHVATDNYGGGKLAAKAIIEALGGSGKVAVLDYPEVESVPAAHQGLRGGDRQAQRVRQAGKIAIVTKLPGGGAKDQELQGGRGHPPGPPGLERHLRHQRPVRARRRGGAGEGGQAREREGRRVRRPARRQAGHQGRQDLRRPDPVPRQDRPRRRSG